MEKVHRRANFTEEESLALVNAVITRKRTILCKLDVQLNCAMKKMAWFEVLAEVNLVSRVIRTVDEIRKKFSDFKSAVKKKAAKEKKYQSGTGENTLLTIIYH